MFIASGAILLEPLLLILTFPVLLVILALIFNEPEFAFTISI